MVNQRDPPLANREDICVSHWSRSKELRGTTNEPTISDEELWPHPLDHEDWDQQYTRASSVSVEQSQSKLAQLEAVWMQREYKRTRQSQKKAGVQLVHKQRKLQQMKALTPVAEGPEEA